MSLKLYGQNLGRNSKIFIAAEYAGVKIDLVPFHPRQASPEVLEEYKKKNPNGLIPLLETPEGCLYESNAILRYIARDTKLYDGTPYQKAIIDQWLDWCALELEKPAITYMLPIYGYIKYDKTSQEQNFETVKKLLRILDDRVKQSKYLAGDHLTIADIYAVALLNHLFRYVLDEKARKPFYNLTKYFEMVINEENFKKVMGRPVLCKTPFQPYTGL